jgi:hypothetical protein
MKTQTLTKSLVGIILLVLAISFVPALVVDTDFVTLYPGESEKVEVEIDNNENFDIEDVSIALDLVDVPFTAVGSSEKDLDDLDEDDDDRVVFTLRASTDATPGDYNIPYTVKYFDVDDPDEELEKEGTFGIRITAKTEIDFAVEIRGNAIVGEEGRISLEIINKGLGEVKSVSVQLLPNGFELLSKDKVFVGTIDADDTDLASFDIVYRTTNPSLSARIEYKDFDNDEQKETVNIPFRVYTRDEALELGLIQKSKTPLYSGVALVVVVAWFVYRRIKKKRKQNRR